MLRCLRLFVDQFHLKVAIWECIEQCSIRPHNYAQDLNLSFHLRRISPILNPSIFLNLYLQRLFDYFPTPVDFEKGSKLQNTPLKIWIDFHGNYPLRANNVKPKQGPIPTPAKPPPAPES